MAELVAAEMKLVAAAVIEMAMAAKGR